MNLEQVINGIPNQGPSPEMQNQVLLRVIANLVAQSLHDLPGGLKGVQTDLKTLDLGILGVESALNTRLQALETTISRLLTSPTVNLSKDDIKALNGPVQQIHIPEHPKSLEVSNLGELEKSIQESIQSLDSINESVKGIKIPQQKDEIEVSNLSEITKKLDDLKKEISKLKLESPESVKVSNLSDLKPPTFELGSEVISHLENLKYLSNDPSSPLSVRLSDGRSFYNAIYEAVKQGVALVNPSFMDASGNPNKALLDANNVVRTSADGYTKRITYTGTSKEEYIGFAVPGASESDAVWQIFKMTYDGSDRLISIKFADGNSNFDNVWSNRASLTYN
jgi:YD repeat-containing protein